MTSSRTTLIQTRIVNGVWEGVLTRTGKTDGLEAVHEGRRLEGLTVTPIPGDADSHRVQLAIPVTVLSEGVQTVVFRAGAEVLASFAVVAGVPLEEDLRAEISLLRAELDLLKKAFRRHVAEAAGQTQIS